MGNKTLKYIRSVHVNNEYANDVPSFAIIELNDKLINWIRRAYKAAQKVGAHKICKYDMTPTFKIIDEDGPPIEVYDNPKETDLKNWNGCGDCLMIEVVECPFEIRWSGFIDHTDIGIDVESISMDEVEENLQVLNAEGTQLPLLLADGALNYDTSKALVLERLKGKPI